MNVLNLKLTLFFFAFLPQFLDASPGLLDVKLIEHGEGHEHEDPAELAAPVARRWIKRVFGAILIGFAAKLAFTDR